MRATTAVGCWRVYAMPFGGEPTGDCRLKIEMEQQRARLDMAVTLFEAGAMSQEELQEVANT